MALDPIQKQALQTACELLEEQIKVVMAMLNEAPFVHLNGIGSAEMVAGMVGALATNYLATVEASK